MSALRTASAIALTFYSSAMLFISVATKEGLSDWTKIPQVAAGSVLVGAVFLLWARRK